MIGTLIQRTLRVPQVQPFIYPHDVVQVNLGDNRVRARQLDAALMTVGFKLSGDLLAYLSRLDPEAHYYDDGRVILNAVRELVGDHVEHNTYFMEFPKNVPDTEEFWASCLRDALTGDDPKASAKAEFQLATGVINLLDLPKYGRYQHTYEEMLAIQDEFIAVGKEHLTVLQLGDKFGEETFKLYTQLAESPIPLNEADRILLAGLAALHTYDLVTPNIPVRENRAIVNRIRLNAETGLIVDTPLDVLRLAAALSDGDETLSTPTRFRSFTRYQRRGMMDGLQNAIDRSEAKLSDVTPYREQFKRLGERLHPHEYPQYPGAQEVFAVARGDRKARSLAGQVEIAIANEDYAKAIRLLSNAPGMLIRNLDRLMRNIYDWTVEKQLIEAVEANVEKVSTRVLLSLREHLQNRLTPNTARMFVNQQGRTWVTADERPTLGLQAMRDVLKILDFEIAKRLPKGRGVMLEDELKHVAVPLSSKQQSEGFGILPRGSITPLPSDSVRFFIYWKEAARRTDYDLSVLLYDEDFKMTEWVSYTRLQGGNIVHSGDVVEARQGASEFIDINLDGVNAAYIVPQINVYSGEKFDEAEEAFFGYMERYAGQQGKPFEPRTVKVKSNLFGSGRVALPLVFMREGDGWCAKWMHLNLRGMSWGNAVETNRVSVELLAKTIVERDYLTLEYLANLMDENRGNGPMIHIGLEELQTTKAGTWLDHPVANYTLGNLTDLIQ